MTATAPDPLTCTTRHGRPAFVVNVEVLLHRDGRWLLIKRGEQEADTPGTLGGAGGKVEFDGVCGTSAAQPPRSSRRRSIRQALLCDPAGRKGAEV